MNKLIFIISIFLFLSSCVNEETIYFNDDNRGWIDYSSENESFLMIDNNNITNDFQQFSESSYFQEGSSAFVFITYKRMFREYISRQYHSLIYNNRFSMSLEAPYEPPGDELFVKINKTGFAYNLNEKTLTRIEVNPTIYFDGVNEYVSNPEDIKSSIENIEATIANKVYKDVLHFTLKDLNSNWEDFTVTEIYVAKNIGLIKYKLNNGITYERINN